MILETLVIVLALTHLSQIHQLNKRIGKFANLKA